MSNQIQRQEPAARLATQGSFADARAASEALKALAEQYNLISPATSVGALPEGCEVVLSHVFVDTRMKDSVDRDGKKTGKQASVSGDVYPTDGGKLGLSKNVLNKIAAAAGIKWHVSCRLDDGSNPFYCRWHVEGSYRSFDGQVQTFSGDKQMDLRNGSKQITGKTERQVDQMRQFIAEHAESKAKLRAIREAFGVKTGYTAEELEKPFVAARVMFTGRSADPETQRMFNQAIAASFLDSSRALFAAATRIDERIDQSEARLAPPPVDTVGDVDSGEYDVDTGEVSQDHSPRSEPRGEPAQTSREAQTGAAPDMELKFSYSKGKKIRDADARDLEWIAETVAGNIDSGESRYPDSDRKLLAAVRAELAQRNNRY